MHSTGRVVVEYPAAGKGHLRATSPHRRMPIRGVWFAVEKEWTKSVSRLGRLTEINTVMHIKIGKLNVCYTDPW